MEEKELIRLWSQKRHQVIHSQLAPTLFLAVTAYLAGTQNLNGLDHFAKAFIAISTAVVGILAIFNQILATRDAMAIADTLKELSKKSPLGVKISNSKNIAATFGVGVNLFGIAAWVSLVVLLYHK